LILCVFEKILINFITKILMKVTKKQSKKDSKELLYDGGDDAPDEG